MSVRLRWPAEKWEKKIPWMCKWFGHVWIGGWYGYKPYLKPVTPGYRDGIDRLHVDLRCECTRCGSNRVIAIIHADSILESEKKQGR